VFAVWLQMTDEQKFALQLQQLAVMGFSNHAANLEGKLLPQNRIKRAFSKITL